MKTNKKNKARKKKMKNLKEKLASKKKIIKTGKSQKE